MLLKLTNKNHSTSIVLKLNAYNELNRNQILKSRRKLCTCKHCGTLGQYGYQFDMRRKGLKIEDLLPPGFRLGRA